LQRWRHTKATTRLSLALLAFGLIAFLPSCQDSDAGSEAESAQELHVVQVFAVAEIQAPRFARASGTLFGDERTTIAAKVTGRVLTVHKDLGDTARAGEPLITLDATDYLLIRDERSRAFQQSLAGLGLEALPEADFDVAALPAVERAGLEEENARARLERGRQLMADDPPIISEQDFADLQTAWEVTQSDVRIERLRAASGLAEAQRLDAQVRIAEQQIADAVHRAPAEESDPQRLYSLEERLVAVGDFVQAGDPLVRLVDPDPVKLRVNVPERLAGVIQQGQTAAATIEASPDKPFLGRVERVSPTVDERTRTYVVEIVIPNPLTDSSAAGRRLKPGTFATAEIQVGADAVLAVPATAVTTFAGVSKLFVVVDGRAEARGIVTGETIGELLEVRSGLAAGELVVVAPPAGLASGMPVTVVQGAVAATPPVGRVPRPGGAGSPIPGNSGSRGQ